MVDHAALDHPDIRGEEAVAGRLVRSGRVRTCGCGLLGLMDIVQLVHVRFQRTLTDPVPDRSHVLRCGPRPGLLSEAAYVASRVFERR
jgi:hypothetical protein